CLDDIAIDHYRDAPLASGADRPDQHPRIEVMFLLHIPQPQTSPPSQLGAHSDRERASVVSYVQQLIAEASTGMVFGIRQVERLKKSAQVAIDVIARAEAPLLRGLQEGRLGTERRHFLLLAELQELLSLPLHRQSRLEPMVLVEADEVRRVA